MERFNYKIIQPHLDTILIKLGYKLEREWPQKYSLVNSGQMTILAYFRLAVNFFNTVTFICADVPDGSNRKLSFSLSAPPLNRTILEIIVSILYLLEDFPKHTDLFYRAGWREEREMIESYKREYNSIPKWDEFIKHRSEFQEKVEKALLITEDEKNNLESVLRWPKVSKIIKRLGNLNSSVVPFIKYLDDWLYRELSAESHIEPSGLSKMGLYFLGMEDLTAISRESDHEKVKEKLDEKLLEFRTKQAWIAVTLIMSLASEIEMHFNYGSEQQLAFIWGVINEYSEIAKEIYDKRYANLLIPNSH
jgi:hypothetical protein